MDIVKLLQGTDFEPVAEKLAAEFEQAGLTLATLHNAPLVIRTTHGADIYRVIEIVEQRLAEQARTPKPVKQSRSTKWED